MSANTALQFGFDLVNFGKEHNNRHIEAKGLRIVGKAYQILGMYSDSFEYLNASLKIFEELEDLVFQSHLLRDFGELNRALKRFDNALSYLDRAYNLANKLQNPELIARTLNRYSAVYAEFDDYLKSIEYAYKSLDVLQKNKNTVFHPAIITSNYNILAYKFQASLTYDSAIYYYNLGIKIARENKLLYEETTLLRNLAGTYLKLGNVDKFTSICKQGLDLALNNTFPDFVTIFSLLLAEESYKQNKFKEAAEYYKIVLNYKDSIFDPRKYTTVLIKNQQLLLDKAEKEKQIKASETKLTYIISSLILITLLIIIVGSFIFFRTRTKLLKNQNTALTEKNEIIQKQNEELNELVATKDKFFSIIAHDLKNPVSGFKVSSQFLSEHFDEIDLKDSRELVFEISKSASSLYDLLENLLTWSRSQRNKIAFNPDYYDINSIVNNAKSILKHLLEKKNQTFINNIPKGYIAYFDLNMVDTIIRNLITNAIKFSEQGKTIEANPLTNEDNDMIYFEIKDYGVGMNKEQVSYAFEIGHSKSTSGTNGEKGTGLGLILCYEFVLKNKGKIEVKSEEGVGTSFIVGLPRHP